MAKRGNKCELISRSRIITCSIMALSMVSKCTPVYMLASSIPLLNPIILLMLSQNSNASNLISTLK